MRIERVEVDCFRVPLPVPVEAYAAGLMKAFDMVVTRVVDSDGAWGFGYTVMHKVKDRRSPPLRATYLPDCWWARTPI